MTASGTVIRIILSGISPGVEVSPDPFCMLNTSSGDVPAEPSRSRISVRKLRIRFLPEAMYWRRLEPTRTTQSLFRIDSLSDHCPDNIDLTLAVEITLQRPPHT